MEKVNEYLKQLVVTPEIVSVAKALGSDAELYVVGGSVRDAIIKLVLGEKLALTTDLDLACNYHPDVIFQRLSSAGFRVIDTGMSHGTLTVLVNEHKMEITTFRSPSARSASQFSDSIYKDLAGRDFTINAIAYDAINFRLVDPYLGIDDLRKNVLRAVGCPIERFKEDPLRLLRSVRFGVAQKRTVDPELERAVCLCASDLSLISVERIKDEFSKILISENIREAMQFLLKTGLLEQFLPEILPCIGFEQNEYHIHDVFEHILDVMEGTPPNLVLRLAALFHDIGKVETLSVDEQGRRHFYCHEAKSVNVCKTVMQRLKFSNNEIQRVSLLVAEHMRTFTCGAAGVRRIIRDVGDSLDDWLILKKADKSPTMSQEEFQQQLDDFLNLLEQELEKLKEPSYGKLAVNGDDLLQIGFKAGPLIGEILRHLTEIVIEDPAINQKEYLLMEAKKFAAESIKKN